MNRRAVFLAAAVAATMLVIAQVVLSLLAAGGEGAEVGIRGGFQLGVALLAGSVAAAAASRSRGRRSVAWACWAAFAYIDAVESAIVFGYSAFFHQALPFPTIADAALLLEALFGIAGALAFSSGRTSRAGVVVALIDGLIIGVGLLMVSWITVLGPIFDRSSDSLLVKAASVVSPLSDVIILTLIATVLIRVSVWLRPSIVLVGLGVAAMLVGDSNGTIQLALGEHAAGAFDAGATAGLLLIGLGAIYPGERRGTNMVRGRSGSGALGVILPIAPVVLAVGFAIHAVVAGSKLGSLVVWSMMILVVLASVRQGLALFMNVQLGKTFAYQASHDELTGLPNRAMLQARLDRAVDRHRGSSRQFALLMIDLDGFKGINDSFGHNIGDQMLVSIAERIVRIVRETDGVARLGGDEFAIVLDPGRAGRAVRVARRILGALEMPLQLEAMSATIDASIGIVEVTADQSALEILRNADLAMYAAKAAGGGQYAIFEPHMHEMVTERVRLENELRQAWMADQLVVVYQPIVDLTSYQMTSVEALVRWQHPTRGLLLPAEFIPVAEETGLIVPIGAKVMREACRQLAAWQLDHAIAADLSMSVNLSVRQLRSADLVDIVTEVLRATGIQPHRLILEVTETAVMQEIDFSIRVLDRLRSLGVRIALDDFGVGSSSLGYVRRLPVDIVKIDKSLVDHVPDGSVASALLDAIAGVARALRLRAVVEGVERPDQVMHLRSAGYELAQGYYFARPMPADGIGELLASGGHFGERDYLFALDANRGSASADVRRVLIVDDNHVLGAAASRILEHHGMVATHVTTYHAAVDALRSGNLDGAVVDIGLPDGDGWEFIERLRADGSHDRTPVVVMTGLDDTAQVLNRAVQLKCEYLGKPFAREALVAKLELARRLVATAGPATARRPAAA